MQRPIVVSEQNGKCSSVPTGFAATGYMYHPFPRMQVMTSSLVMCSLEAPETES